MEIAAWFCGPGVSQRSPVKPRCSFTHLIILPTLLPPTLVSLSVHVRLLLDVSDTFRGKRTERQIRVCVGGGGLPGNILWQREAVTLSPMPSPPIFLFFTILLLTVAGGVCVWWGGAGWGQQSLFSSVKCPPVFLRQGDEQNLVFVLLTNRRS